MRLIIDRFEGQFAVCEGEDGKMVNIKIPELPKGVKEGDVLNKDGDVFTIDSEGTKERASKIKKMMNGLWEK